MTNIPEDLRKLIPDKHLIYFDKWMATLEKEIEADCRKEDTLPTVRPRNFINWWKQYPSDEKGIAFHDHEKAVWFVQRFRCLCDHIFLSGFVEDGGMMEPILGMDFKENPHRMLFNQFILKQPGVTVSIEDPTTHNAMEVPIPLSDLERTFKKRMILWPRGLFKTSSVIVEIVQCILNYPNIRICFLTGGDHLAKRQLARVKKIFEHPSARFQWLFPEFCTKSTLNKKTGKWEDGPVKMGNAHEFTVPSRTNRTFAEPTFAISTAKSVKAGSHYDLIFIDDLVNDQNYKSVKALEKCYQDYLDICPVLDPSGFMILTGTRYSFGDTYERIQEMAKVEEKELGKTIWTFSIRDCWSQGMCGCGHTDCMHDEYVNKAEPPCILCDCKALLANDLKGVLFPETRTFDGRSIGHTLEFLQGEKVRLGEEFFANQYENRPMAKDSQTFPPDLIAAQTLFHLEQIPSYLQSYTFAVADLAYIGQEDRDVSVIFVCRMFQGQIFVYDCLYGNWDASAVAQNMVNMLIRHRPAVVFPEKFNGWEAYHTIIESLALQKGLQKVPLQWLKGSQASKAKMTRIGSAKGPMKDRRLWLYAGMPGYATLVKQLEKWPKLGRHDDFADCLGQVVAAPSGYQNEKPPVAESGLHWLARLNQSAPLDESYYDNGCGTGFCC